MDQPGLGTSVEIELTPNDAPRLRRRRSPAASFEPARPETPSEEPAALPELATQLPPSEGASPNSAERRKLLLVAGAVAIVALVVGWAIGRAGRSPARDEAQPAATNADAAPSVEILPLAEVATTVPVPIAVTTRPRPQAEPVTDDAREWQIETVDVDPAIAPLALDIVMVGGTRIAEFDTTTGELHTLPLDSPVSQPQFVDAGADWFVIRNFDSGSAQLVRDGEIPVEVPILDVWSSHFQRDSGLFLQAAREYTAGAPLAIVEVDHEGNDTGRRFEMPGGVWPAAPDPAGGVVVSAAGGTYHAGPEGSRRLTTGNLLALSPRVVLQTDCGGDFSDCGMYIVDRRTGAQLEVVPYDPESGPLDVLDIQSPAFWSSPELMGGISPDDRWAPIMVSDDRQQFGLIDMITGELVVLGANSPTGLWWSPDARFAIYNQSSRLMLFDTQQRTTTDIAPHGISVDAFAVRPAD